jgi:hypothetical protein
MSGTKFRQGLLKTCTSPFREWLRLYWKKKVVQQDVNKEMCTVTAVFPFQTMHICLHNFQRGTFFIKSIIKLRRNTSVYSAFFSSSSVFAVWTWNVSSLYNFLWKHKYITWTSFLYIYIYIYIFFFFFGFVTVSSVILLATSIIWLQMRCILWISL